MKKKIKNHSGVTIIETLVAILIAALMTGLLATGALTAGNMIRKAEEIRQKTEATWSGYYLETIKPSQVEVEMNGTENVKLNCKFNTYINNGDRIYDFSAIEKAEAGH